MKITKFFAMALAALTIASCAKQDIGIENGPDGEGINTPTYATFKFNIGGGSKAVTDFDPTTTPEQDVKDAKIGSLQLLIFNATTQALEFNEVVTGSTSKTVLLTAGRKKIFFIANSDKLTDYNSAINPTTFLPGAGTLAVFNALDFSAGTPQKFGATETRTFGFSELYTLSNEASGKEAGLPMSNTNEITYTLAAGVSESDAQGGSAVLAGSSATNTFNVQLYYMTAKARLVLAADVLSAGDAVSKPTISDVKYSIRNLARATNYVQNVPTAGNPQSYYFSSTFSNQAAFDAQFDYASNINVPVTSTAGGYLYVPENNNALLARGQSSYFAIKATYEPVVISAAIYDINTKIKYTYSKLASADPVKNYIYTTKDVQGIAAGAYFVNVAKLEEAAWIMKNSKPFIEADNRAEAKTLVAATDYLSFTGAASYYRIDMGSGTGAETEYGVLRSNKYNATINKITGPGVPSEGDLTTDPENPVSAKTYIQATIIPAVWKAVTQAADL